MQAKGYDFIGDIHGHCDELIKLLIHLGYQATETGFQHENRKVVFLGDFIDRGEHLRQHKQLLSVVMAMVGNGHALAVMGNHEFNALAYHTVHAGEYLRPHSEKNKKQHRAFLNEYEDDADARQEVLKFFYSLPLWLELDGFRAIHACWAEEKIDYIKTRSPTGLLSPSLLIEAARSGTAAYEAIEVLLKGFEVTLPEGITFKDQGQHERSAVRVGWWNRRATELGEIHLPRDIDIGPATHHAVPGDMPRYEESSLPCFIGHYWLSGKPIPLASNVACLDYSVAKEGKLVAYRWSGEKTLTAENFTYAGV